MCIAIYNNNNEIPFEIIQNCFNGNPDGAGLMFAHKKQVHAFKTFDLHSFYKAYLEALDKADKGQIVLHFRIGTQGKLSTHNIHPFLNWKNKIGFVHNGILRNFTGQQYRTRNNAPFSDTYHFNEQIVSKIPQTFMSSVKQRKGLENYISANGYNKMIFLDYQARVAILNEYLGEWHEENWYSNDSYLGVNRYAGHIKL
jgi:predicted glutamine amidotransferase